MKAGPLEGLRVVEWALGVPGSYCGKLLADLGAEVIKIEGPEGNPIRNEGPFPDDIPGIERSAIFLHLNVNKLGITLNLESTTGQTILQQLLKDTDIFVTDCELRTLRDHGLEYAALAKANPQLIFTPITPFGLTGPYKDYKATDLITYHMSGYGHSTPGRVDDPAQEPPLRSGGRQSEYAAGLIAAIGAMHAVFTRFQTGRGQLVDVSRHESLTSFNLTNLATYSFTGQTPVRHRGGRGMGALLLPCIDGWVCFIMLMDYQWGSFLDALGNPEWGTWEVFASRNSRNENWDAMEPLLHEETLKFTIQELTDACQKRRVSCLPVNTIKRIVDSEHLAARNFFVEVEHPVVGKVRLPRSPFVFSATPLSIRTPAPLLGEHNAAVLSERLGYPPEEVATMKSTGVI